MNGISLSGLALLLCSELQQLGKDVSQEQRKPTMHKTSAWEEPLFVLLVCFCNYAWFLYASQCAATPAEHRNATRGRTHAHACVSVVGRWKRSIPEGVCCTATQWEQGVSAKRGGKNPHLRVNPRLVRDRGGWDLSLNIRLRGLRQMIGISSALPSTSDRLSLYLLSVRLVPPVPPY